MPFKCSRCLKSLDATMKNVDVCVCDDGKLDLQFEPKVRKKEKKKMTDTIKYTDMICHFCEAIGKARINICENCAIHILACKINEIITEVKNQLVKPIPIEALTQEKIDQYVSRFEDNPKCELKCDNYKNLGCWYNFPGCKKCGLYLPSEEKK